jgi:predicted glycosyl hydrolase (DUF1957 family)
MSVGYLAMVFHAHLPFVRHPEDATVMEEQWLYEAITGTYLPMVQLFEGLLADGVRSRATVSLSAPLIHMLTDDLLKERYAARMDQLIELAEKKSIEPATSRTTSATPGCTSIAFTRFATPGAATTETWSERFAACRTPARSR